ncbi:hypothetical protein DM860_000480 [Cuscuta australis]|uniref:Endonuclease/exonuclease/phosphatase domain-containing protein n=1 Tax=Cuscuta australis TaxID=267555 RepID=A0A328CXF0_9ASTE|nr:hypothetical protein DM860_000480 [Cuscuta australis]
MSFINNSAHPLDRIWVLWKPNKINITIKKWSDQWVHCLGRRLDEHKEVFITFVYGHNEAARRVDLWKDLGTIASTCDKPWCIIGDFNSVLELDDRIGGNPVTIEETSDFKNCVQTCGLEEIPSEGSKYTWSNRQGCGRRIYSKIDRALANIDWFNCFNTKILVKEEGLSDHSPLLMREIHTGKGNIPFKFCNMWLLDPLFPTLVEAVWQQRREGRYMHQLVCNLKDLKPGLRRLNKDKFSHIYQQCN